MIPKLRPHLCEFCRTPFMPSRKGQIYCSDSCRTSHHRKQVELDVEALLNEVYQLKEENKRLTKRITELESK